MAFKILSYHSHLLQIIPPPGQIPPGSVQIVLTVNVGYITATDDDDPFFSQRTLCFSLNLLQSPRLPHQVLAPKLEELRVDMSSDEYEGVLQDIMQCGIGTVGDVGPGILLPSLASAFGYACGTHGHDHDQPGDLDDQSFGGIEEGVRKQLRMVGAAESSVKKMVKRVKVEDGEKGNCMVCLEELRVGFEASQCLVLMSFMAVASKDG